MAFKLGVIFVLGIPALAVLIFELALSAASLFTHSNLYLPGDLDRRLRWLFVTPEMRRVHHRRHRDETDNTTGSTCLYGTAC